ncbi:MAG: SGNH/GDSL hydrolase family protein [Candidatus Microsaccharimonas sp.]
MWWAILKWVRVVVYGVVFGLVFSTSVHAWSASEVPKYLLSEVKTTDPFVCTGNLRTISVSGEGSTNACVMGNTTKIAQYYAAQGGIAYAVGFPLEDTFYHIDICEGKAGCSYSDNNDTFIGFSGGKAVIYRHFFAALKKDISGGVIRYVVTGQVSAFTVTHPSGIVFPGQSVALSENGQWALVEIKAYGFYRINTQTSEVRRIVAPGFRYGYGADPLVEMAISNDGTLAAIMGIRVGLNVVAVNDTCGDQLNSYTQTEYLGAVTPCAYLSTPTDAYISNFNFASKPRFSQDSSLLSYDVYGGGTSRHVTLFSNKNTLENRIAYLAIGDSYASGEGETDDAFYIDGPENRCHVSYRSYPYLIATVWHASAFNAACSGATIESAHKLRQGAESQSQFSQIESRLPEILTVSFGGNDAGFMGKLKSCVGLGTCEWAENAAKRRATALEIRNLYPKLKSLYQQLAVKVPGKVIVIGYPLIISDDEVCTNTVSLLLDQTERRFMKESIHYLNQIIKAAAIEAGVEYVDTEQSLAGGELCSATFSPTVNGIRLGNDFSPISNLPDIKIIGAESFHPTPEGHQRVKQAIFTVFPAKPVTAGCQTCTGYNGVPQPGVYWESDETVGKNQQAASVLSEESIQRGKVVEVALPAYSFAPLSKVTLELHSDLRTLQQVSVASDGSLRVELLTTGLPLGFHSVHVIGKSYSGTDVDMYDFLSISEAIGGVTGGSERANISGGDNPNKPLSESGGLGVVSRVVSPAGVLGAAITTPLFIGNMPINSTPTHTQKKLDTAMPNMYLIDLIILGIGSALASIGVLMGVLIRRKPSRYTGG